MADSSPGGYCIESFSAFISMSTLWDYVVMCYYICAPQCVRVCVCILKLHAQLWLVDHNNMICAVSGNDLTVQLSTILLYRYNDNKGLFCSKCKLIHIQIHIPLEFEV